MDRPPMKMSGFDRLLIEPMQPAHRLLRYWSSLRHSGEPPNMSDFRMEKLEDLVPNLILLQREDDDVFRCMMSGSRVSSIFGLELTNLNILELTTDEDVHKLSLACLTAACCVPCGVCSVLNVSTAGHDRTVQVFTLPLKVGGNNSLLVEIHLPGEFGHQTHDLSDGPRIIERNPPIFIDIGFGVPDCNGEPETASSDVLDLESLIGPRAKNFF